MNARALAGSSTPTGSRCTPQSPRPAGESQTASNFTFRSTAPERLSTPRRLALRYAHTRAHPAHLRCAADAQPAILRLHKRSRGCRRRSPDSRPRPSAHSRPPPAPGLSRLVGAAGTTALGRQTRTPRTPRTPRTRRPATPTLTERPQTLTCCNMTALHRPHFREPHQRRG